MVLSTMVLSRQRNFSVLKLKKFFSHNSTQLHICVTMPKHARGDSDDYREYECLYDYVIGGDQRSDARLSVERRPFAALAAVEECSTTEGYSQSTVCDDDVDPDQDDVEHDPDIMEPPPKKEGRGVRRWCFTLNNYTDQEVNDLKDWLTSHTDYHIVHYEVGKQGTPHLQGYFRLKSTAVSSALHKKPGLKRASLFICKGTEDQNIKYCSKGGVHTICSTSGIPQPGQGARSDLKEAAALVRDGGHKAIKKIALDKPDLIVKYGRGFKELLEVLDIGRMLDAAPEAIWYYGESGSGKSVAAYELAKAKCAELSCEQVELDSGLFPFCDGYRDEEVIILNDFRQKNHHGQDIQLDLMLKMVDRFPFRMNIKGSSRQLKGKVFIFTNTQHPSHFFTQGGSSEPQKQWLRRITRVVKCVKSKVDGEDVYTQEECGNGEQPETVPFANAL